METTAAAKKHFTRALTSWHATENYRSLPWKSEKDPYKIWLSEIILQQTRALQGLPYYLNFTQHYPTVTALANAREEDAFRLWQGLGYYNRCKNMLATARIIANDLNGIFPDTYDGLLQLKGIGPYTASAIASFAFGLPTAVVDGNVNRVLSRYFGIDNPIDTTEGKKIFNALATELLDKGGSAAYNQAIMDLGATICTPRKPVCDQCPLQKHCVAYHHQLIDILPVKSKKLVVKKRYFNYFLLVWNGKIWIHKRTGKDIWANLHEPLLIETPEPLPANELPQNELLLSYKLPVNNITSSGTGVQRLTHQLIYSQFFTIPLTQKPAINIEDGIWLTIKDLKKIAFPKTIVSFLEKNLYF
jgi:A/G-specific adenine glycosylase